jgi:hypothetical protein
MMDTSRNELASEKSDRLRESDQLNKRIDNVTELFKIKASRTN